MKLFLSDTDKEILDKRIEEAEQVTKAQIVLATVKRSDSYAEIPWQAFAFGASLAGLLVIISTIISPFWISTQAILISSVAILATGGLFALLSILSEGFAKLFLSAPRLKPKYGNLENLCSSTMNCSPHRHVRVSCCL